MVIKMKCKKKKKGIAPLYIGIVLAAVVLVGAGLYMTDGFTYISSWIGSLEGPKTCDETPYDDNCYCNPDEDKQKSPFSTWGHRWYCEQSVLVLDPDSPTFQQDAINYVKAYLSRHSNGKCNLECGEICTDPFPGAGTQCIEASWGQGQTGERLINVECKKMVSSNTGYSPWRMQFLVEYIEDKPRTYEVFENSNYCVAETTDCNSDSDCLDTEVCSTTPGKCATRYSTTGPCEHWGNPEWCVPSIPMTVIPTPGLGMVFYS